MSSATLGTSCQRVHAAVLVFLRLVQRNVLKVRACVGASFLFKGECDSLRGQTAFCLFFTRQWTLGHHLLLAAVTAAAGHAGAQVSQSPGPQLFGVRAQR